MSASVVKPATSRDERYRLQAQRERRRAEGYRNLLIELAAATISTYGGTISTYKDWLSEDDLRLLENRLRR